MGEQRIKRINIGGIQGLSVESVNNEVQESKLKKQRNQGLERYSEPPTLLKCL